jgi:hypothetical protein
MTRVHFAHRSWPAASVLALILAVASPVVAQAQSTNPDRCRAYADAQVALGLRADAKACPEFKRRAQNWDGHFNWCLGQTRKRVDDEQSTYDAKFDGCMAAVEAAKTEKALADADRKAQIDGQIGSYDERWRKGVKRMADLGMRKPHHPNGFEADAVSTESKRWGAGLVKDQQLGYYLVCDTCKGLTARVRDSRGSVIESKQTEGNALELIAYPQVGGQGSLEIIVTNCQTRNDTCKVRFTSFLL